ncbi:MAG: beta-ketoacyl synthase chain length factor [Crocinitomicaceae bacterium]
MYIKDCFAISPQRTFDDQFEKGHVEIHEEKVYSAIEPNYAEFIPAGLLRRMGKAVRMGIGAAMPLLKRNGQPEGIIIGTANGGLENCIQFLNQIVEYDEGVLTPTHFVQSTPNALAGQLALMTENTGYNNTHINGSLAFENALLDADMYLENLDYPSTLLVGAVEEISEYNYNIDLLADRYKQERVSNDHLLASQTPGTVCGEGSTMFIIGNEKENSIAEIVDFEQINFLEIEKLNATLAAFLQKNQLSIDAIDLVLLGKNGDNRFDNWYETLENNLLKNNRIGYYKPYVGEYRTSSAFAVYYAVQLLNGKCKNDTLQPDEYSKSPKTVLLYNHFEGLRHSIILIKK